MGRPRGGTILKAPVVSPPLDKKRAGYSSGLRPGGKRVQPAFGRAKRTQRESWRRPQGSAVWPSEGLNARVLAIAPQSTLKRSHKAISKKSRGFLMCPRVSFSSLHSPGALLRVASISDKHTGSLTGWCVTSLHRRRRSRSPTGHSELCPVGRGQQAHA